MHIQQAIAAARKWLQEQGVQTPGFIGAYLFGSAADLPDGAELPPASDLDVMLVLEGPEPPTKPGKFIYQGALLEVSYLPAARVAKADLVLADYHLAGGFRQTRILADPTGRLASVQSVVAREFARPEWVRRRVEHASGVAIARADGLTAGSPLHDQVMTWLFAAGGLPHVLLVAGLRNPTVRKRYLAARELLSERGRLDFYERLLQILGCEAMGPDRVEQHLAQVAEAFDAAKLVLKTPYQFSADLTDAARPVAIGGSRELIRQGWHREAVFWMLATYSRCQWALAHDAPADVLERHAAAYTGFLADLGITDVVDLQRRAEEVRLALPAVRDAAEEIMERP